MCASNSNRFFRIVKKILQAGFTAYTAAHVPAAAVLSATLFSCGLIALDDADIVTWPDTKDQVLADEEELWVRFPPGTDITAAESLVTVNGGEAGRDLDFRGAGDTLFITPVPALKPGLRYTLRISGTLICLDGRRFNVHRVLPFYAVSAYAPLRLVEVLPEDGGDASEKTALRFTFDRPLQTEVFKREFFINPSGDWEVLFSKEDTCAEVTPKEGWNHHTLYTWTFPEQLCDTAGVTLAADISGTFIVQEDGVPPELLSITPVFYFDGDWLPLPGLGKRDSLLFTFSEKIDPDSLTAAFSIFPSVIGDMREAGQKSAVFMPLEDFIMNTEYTIRVTGDLTDPSGNYLIGEFRQTIVPDIPLQSVPEIRLMDDLSGTNTVTLGPDGYRLPTPVEVTLGGVDPDFYLVVSITFRESFDPPFREAISGRIRLSSFFPADVPDPSPVSKVWSSFGTVYTAQYEGLEKSEAANPPGIPAAVPKLYRLLIPGSKALSENQNGSFLPGDVWVLIRTEDAP